MKISHQDLPATTEDQGAQDTDSVTPSPASRIVGFTNNLLATSVVIVVALAVGNQLITLWGRQDSSNIDATNMTSVWPAIENCAIEFGGRPYSMTRQQIEGDTDRAVEYLSEKCQKLLRAEPDPVGTVGESEARMIADAKSLTPLAMDEGRWRLFQVKNPNGDNLPMVVGLRDNCDSISESGSSRLVTWGIAMPSGEKAWTALVCSTNAGTDQRSSELLDLLTPLDSRQTLGINGDNGGKLIGFTGGEPESAKRFYQQLAERKNWTLMDWRRTGDSWQSKLLPNSAEEFSEIQIQLSFDSTQNLRGLLVVEPKPTKE